MKEKMQVLMAKATMFVQAHKVQIIRGAVIVAGALVGAIASNLVIGQDITEVVEFDEVELESDESEANEEDPDEESAED